MKKIYLTLLFLAVIVIPFLIAVNVSSCTSTEDNTNVTCTGCSTSTPWSKPGTNRCYATKTECESAEGSGCVLCN